MVNIDIPGRGRLELRFLVADYNGTLACDGVILPEAVRLLQRVAGELEIHVITADTFGIAAENLRALPVKLTILPAERQAEGKAAYIKQLGAQACVCLGNGRNDLLMLRDAALGICLIGPEGGCVSTLQEADVVCRSVSDALELLINPKRLIATLRS